MEAVYEQRRPLVKRLLAERPWCEACPIWAKSDGKMVYTRRPSQDAHEILTRARGGSILDEKNILMVCRPCHDRIDSENDLAEKLGLLAPSWAKPPE